MRYISILILISFWGCENERYEVEGMQVSSKARGSRYEVSLVDPPTVFENAAAILIVHEEFPSIHVFDNSGEIYKNQDIKEESKNGLGPSFLFKRDYKARNEKKFNYGSIKFLYKNNLIKSDLHYAAKNVFAEAVYFSDQDITSCETSLKDGLVCQSDCIDLSLDKCPSKAIWSDINNPVVEVNINSYPGNYAMTENGTLFHFMRERREISDATIVHKDIKFRKNRHGRYFINTNSDAACVQSEDFAVYCSEVYLKSAHSSYAPTTKEWPSLSKIVQLDFPIEQATFSGRHYCFLSESGEVYCMGDNRCGQITGRHDEIPEFKEPKRLDFLKYPAIGIAVYAGGSCVVLNNGQVQCFGLGASVLRKRRWPDGAYRRSFSWLHGFRPHQICGGGAENGI